MLKSDGLKTQPNLNCQACVYALSWKFKQFISLPLNFSQHQEIFHSSYLTEIERDKGGQAL